VFFVLYLLVSSLDIHPVVSALIQKHNEDIGSQFSQIGDVAVHGMRHDPSMKSRIDAWEEAIDYITQYPLLGQGCGSTELSWADNQYVTEILQTGAIGLIVFFVLNWKIFMSLMTIKVWTDDPLYKGLALGFAAGQIGMLVHGITVSNFFTIMNMEFFWLTLAVILTFYRDLLKERERSLMSGNNEFAKKFVSVKLWLLPLLFLFQIK
jgi:O-antigen ligase